MPGSLLDPIREQVAAVLPARPAVCPSHPLGRHRRRVADRVVSEHVVDALLHGSGDERIASPGCSDRTTRRRLHAWAAAGLAATLPALGLPQSRAGAPAVRPDDRARPCRRGGRRRHHQGAVRRRGGTPTRALLHALDLTGEIAHTGVPAPLQASQRRVVERTQAWRNGDGTPRRRTERRGVVVDCSLLLAAAFVVTRCLIREARTRYRWPGRPTTRRLP